MEKKKLAIFGCGKLAEIIVDALLKDLLTDYQLIGTFSNTKEKAERLAARINDARLGYSCNACSSIEELLRLKPDYIVESASPSALRELALPALKNRSSLLTLSIGAFADEAFYEEVRKTALENDARVHLVSGAIGGFDVLNTVALMGDCKASFDTEKGPRSLRDSSVYEESLQTKKKKVFEGNAKEAIALFPTKVNVAVAASLASVGTQDMKVSMTSTPDFVGDEHRIRIIGDQVDAKIDVYSKTGDIAAWSVVNTLRNITSPIVF